MSASVSPLWRACVTKYERRPCRVTCPICNFLQATVMRCRIAETSRGLVASNGDENKRSPAARVFISFNKTSISSRIGTQGVPAECLRSVFTVCEQFHFPHANPICPRQKFHRLTEYLRMCPLFDDQTADDRDFAWRGVARYPYASQSAQKSRSDVGAIVCATDCKISSKLADLKSFLMSHFFVDAL